MAASLMWRGVGKCGSPAPKSTRFAPWARSLAASAATAMVAETSIRPMRSAKTFEGAAIVVVIPLSLQILGTGGTRECWRGPGFRAFPDCAGSPDGREMQSHQYDGP